MTPEGDRAVTLVLGGDVMLGRGVDQLLAHPGDSALWESGVHDARTYIELAERVCGPIPTPVDDTWPWGDALADLTDPAVAARILNLETSITTSEDFASRKAVHYRMSPDNLGCLLAAAPDVCVLANNHVLDFGRRGLEETLDVLGSAGLPVAGAGRDADRALAPAVVPVRGGRVAVVAVAHSSSGVPRSWAADVGRSGVALLPDLSDATAEVVGARVHQEKSRGAVVVVSVHWGSNWGMAIPGEQVRFAHRLVDAGADVVHGHSSHHPRPLEVYAGRLVLYGCGDLVNDYEGIRGHEEYRGDLRLLYRLSVDPVEGALQGLDLLPFRSRRLRLERAGTAEAAWLAALLDEHSRTRGVRVRRQADHLELDWQPVRP